MPLAGDLITYKTQLEEALSTKSRDFWVAMPSSTLSGHYARFDEILYEVISELGKSYPFTPEQLGYARVDAKLQEPRSLSNYQWLEDTDKLVDVEDY
jgi:hypothetical protein